MQNCPTGARTLGDAMTLGDEVAEIIATTEVHVLKPELHTEPNCYYSGLEPRGALMHDQAMNFLFPNDFHIMWSLMIVLYPYITGLVAGAFIVSSLYHVFGRTELKPVARLAMVASLSFLLVATLPLLAHLGHPERALNIMITPHFTSAMCGLRHDLRPVPGAGAGRDLADLPRWRSSNWRPRSRGFKRRVFSSVSPWASTTPRTRRRAVDHRVIAMLAAVGIPAACILHGYVGFMFGSVKANALWSTPLMPIIFLFSAVTSGIAMIMVLYEILTKVNGRRIDGACVQSLAQWLWLFATVTVTLEVLEIVTLSYEQNEEWLVVGPLIFDKIAFSLHRHPDDLRLADPLHPAGDRGADAALPDRHPAQRDLLHRGVASC